MSNNSPLFVSSLELFAHAVELFGTKKERNLKFVILHLANGVELLCKDVLLNLGESIYRSPKETMSIWATFEQLEKRGLHIPQRQYVELLIDDRNTIQHRYGFPDERSAFFYITVVTEFFRSWLQMHYSLPFDEVITEYLEEPHLPLVGLSGPDAKVRSLFKVSPPAAIIEAFSLLQDQLLSLVQWRETPPASPRSNLGASVIEEISRQGWLTTDALQHWESLRHARNAAAHGATSLEWKSLLDTYTVLSTGVSKAKSQGFRLVLPSTDSGGN